MADDRFARLLMPLAMTVPVEVELVELIDEEDGEEVPPINEDRAALFLIWLNKTGLLLQTVTAGKVIIALLLMVTETAGW